MNHHSCRNTVHPVTAGATASLLAIIVWCFAATSVSAEDTDRVLIRNWGRRPEKP
ncbi:hypothetical protein ABI_40560 [Asticcacaulis biprosthecium C19]|uniref:Uncharacterized protein n=1 Tax=Asticcacaulis biprosthecium C19 TaxID=715226 RepID=F4QSB2_9CAUL|nr:hypothetical protein ABI_40560 [Asticcacaulis biprosthecium C19]